MTKKTACLCLCLLLLCACASQTAEEDRTHPQVQPQTPPDDLTPAPSPSPEVTDPAAPPADDPSLARFTEIERDEQGRITRTVQALHVGGTVTTDYDTYPTARQHHVEFADGSWRITRFDAKGVITGEQSGGIDGSITDTEWSEGQPQRGVTHYPDGRVLTVIYRGGAPVRSETLHPDGTVTHTPVDGGGNPLQ